MSAERCREERTLKRGHVGAAAFSGTDTSGYRYGKISCVFPSYSLPLFFIGAEFEASPGADGPTAAARGCCFPRCIPTQRCGLRNPPALHSRGEGKLCPRVEIRGCEARPLGRREFGPWENREGTD